MASSANNIVGNLCALSRNSLSGSTCEYIVQPKAGLFLHKDGTCWRARAGVQRHPNKSTDSFTNGTHSFSKKQYGQFSKQCRATLDGNQATEEANKVTEGATESDKSRNGSLNGPEKAKELLLSAAQQLKVQADALTTQASIATVQLVETAGHTAEQLKVETDKTAVHLKSEAEKAAEELKIQSEKAAQQLAETVHETAEIAKEGLVLIAENSPESVKEIAEVALQAHSKEAAAKGAVIHDFCLGIPYGALLAVGGVAWFLLTGSLNGLRFGTILGGILLACSVQSLRLWQQEKSTNNLIVAQAAVASIILLKQALKYFQTGVFFPTGLSAFASALMIAFYTYVLSAGGPPRRSQSFA